MKSIKTSVNNTLSARDFRIDIIIYPNVFKILSQVKQKDL
jgi:hypothetical protein